MGVTMLTNAIANIICISRFGIVGASIAGCLTFSVMFVLGVFAIRKQIHVSLREWMRAIGGFVFAGVVMDIVLFGVRSLVPSWIALIPIGAFVFIAIAFVTKSFTFEHVRHIRTLLKPSYGTPVVANE